MRECGGLRGSVAARLTEAAAAALGAAPGAERKTKKKAGEEFKVHDEREHLNIVFIGHVDAGKSTISGQVRAPSTSACAHGLLT